MKKVLSFVLVLSMILGSFGMAFAAPADVEGKDYEDAVNVLVELGVVAGYKDGTFRPENIVTRAEMATFLIKAMGLADYAVGASSFSDMAGHWADPFVAYASSLGIVAGYADGTFKPDVTVSYDQAITMVVQALGYKGEYLVGGFPGAFVNKAKALGILDGVVSGAAGANRGDVATLLFNALDAPFVRYDADGAEEYTKPAETMMTRLAGKDLEVKTKVIVGTEDALINIAGYQGAYADYYWDKADEEIVAVKEVKSTFLTGEFDGDKFVADDVEYTLVEGEFATVHFLNGKVTDAAIELTDEDTVTIAAKVSGKKIKEVYSVAEWTASGYFQWNEDDAEKLAEDDVLGFDEQAAFVMNDDEEIDTDEFVLVGVDALADIEEDNIVTFYTADGKITKIAVGTEKVEGKITGKTKGGDYVINGKTYEVELVEGETIALGDEGTFFLNAAGKIAASEAVSETTDYAVITKAVGQDTNSYEAAGDWKVKLLNADGKEVTYVLTDAAKTDLTGAEAGTVVSYVLNKDGEIKEADVATTAAAATMSTKGYLDKKPVAESVVVFYSELNSDDEVEYKVGKLADVPVNEALTETFYVVEEGEVVVIFCNDAEEKDGIYGLAVNYAIEYTADEDTIVKVDLLIDGKVDTYTWDAATIDIDMDVLYEFTFSGEELTAFVPVAVEPVEGTVYGVKDGNIQLSEDGDYEEVAADAVVYEWNSEDEIYEAAEIKDVAKKGTVVMFQMDSDDEDGFDIILFADAE